RFRTQKPFSVIPFHPCFLSIKNKTFCFTKRKNILFIALQTVLLSLHKAFFFRCKQEIMILFANL
ncbi:hypothetical protein, partial [Prevotella sp.]|uniref:hypothetical protein n=1 Tax=Prevotella sp. TaxID=59823 RepID=UPI0025CFD695